MAIQYPTVIDESLQALNRAAQELHPTHSNILEMIKQVHDSPTTHQPHPVYAVGLADIGAANLLQKARIIGWRYVAQSPRAENYVIEVRIDANGKNHRFGGVHKGPYVEGMLKVLDDAKFDQRINSGAYTLAVLVIHALGVFALWLRENSGDDRLIAVQPAPKSLQPWPTIYEVTAFQDALRAAAQRKLTYDVSALV